MPLPLSLAPYDYKPSMADLWCQVAGVAGSFFLKKTVSHIPGIFYYFIEVVAVARTGTGHSCLSWFTFCKISCKKFSFCPRAEAPHFF